LRIYPVKISAVASEREKLGKNKGFLRAPWLSLGLKDSEKDSKIKY